jgi:Predicted nucleoside-diphosphate sugar epimerases
MFNGKVKLITGGTGTFGNAVLRRFLNTEIKEIRVFSRDEKKQEALRISLANPKVKFFVGDVRNSDSYFISHAGCKLCFSCNDL